MFICMIGGHVTEPRVPLVRVIVETRMVSYLNKVRRHDEFGNYLQTDTIPSNGMEIVREIDACPDCVGHRSGVQII